jgi:hypothetical protein
MLYVLGHSAAWTGTPSYVELLGAQRTRSCHFYFYTVLGALYEAKQLHLKPEDRVVFNFGINDCIYRKTKNVQLPIFKGLIEATAKDDPDASRYFQTKLDELKHKRPEDLMQLFSFDAFKQLTTHIFSHFKNQGLVIGVAWFPESHPTYYYATKEAEQTNNILKESACECGLEFMDMWHPPELTKDGSHYTLEGHMQIANYVKEKMIWQQ